ncbi:cyclin [Verticillium dahliae]
MSSTTDFNAAALHSFLNQPVNPAMIIYLAECASDVVECVSTLVPSLVPSLTSHQGRPSESAGFYILVPDLRLPSLQEFIYRLVELSKIETPILMSTLIYLARLKRRLQSCQGSPSTSHRIFLAALILSTKYHDDTPYTNGSWARLSRIATQRHALRLSCDDVNHMERELLLLLNWDVSIPERDLYTELRPLINPVCK